MKRPFATLGPEFGPFLYASVGEEGNGMMLSVLSTLARRDLDPWREAAELATLPVDVAADRLASSISGLPGTARLLNVGGTAQRLILLLPKRASSTAPRCATTVDDALGLTKSSLIIWMVTMGLILGVQAIAASSQPHGQVAQAPASAASTILKPTPPVGRD